MQGTRDDMSGTSTTVQLRYSLGAVPESWVLEERNVPESTLHHDTAKRVERAEAQRERARREVLERELAELRARAGG